MIKSIKTVTKEPDELPVLESIGWTKTKQGWVVFLIKTQGNQVIDKEILSEPDLRNITSERLKIEVVRRFLHPNPKDMKA